MIRNSPHSPVIEQSLYNGRASISARIQPLKSQRIAVAEALHCISAEPLSASRPKPFFDQASRDGYALSAHPVSVDDSKAFFFLGGELAAGSWRETTLKSGEAVRIMTGAMLPPGSVRVVPFEVCSEQKETVEVPLSELDNRHLYIRHQSSEVMKGKLLVSTGTLLLPDHLLMLAESGCFDLSVYRRPRVAVICTGSELVEAGEVPGPGQKISGNGVLLPALLKREGADCICSFTVADHNDLIVEQVQHILAQQPDMIISTGGMGPGKFDLMEQVFADIGGTVVYNRLLVRPGKFTLFGMIGRIPFFALPGPPPAVRILFHELIVPALNRLQGREDGIRKLVRATLVNSLSVKQTGHLNLKGAVVELADSGLLVHPAGKMEPINAIIHLEEKRTSAAYGEEVKIRLVGSLSRLTV